MAKTDTPETPEPSVEQAAALAEAAAAADATTSRAKSKELVTVVLESASVQNFVVYATREIEMPTGKNDGSTEKQEVEYPVVVSRDGSEVPAGLVDHIREAAHAAGLIVNVKD